MGTGYKFFCFFVVFFASAILIPGCASIKPAVLCERGDVWCKTKGNFTGRWYDYYERALSCMEGGCYQAALADLKKAIERRADDKRWVNTYGMRFMDYFPHRWAGISHYRLGDYENAAKELKISISREPTAMARSFLDEVRKRVMEIEQQPVSEPDLKIRLPDGIFPGPAEVITASDPVEISGVAEDRQYVSAIFISGKSILMESSGLRVTFKERLHLSQGIHPIEIRARNLMGGEKSRKIIIRADRSGPVIVVDKFVPGNFVSGHVFDRAGVAFVAMTNGIQKNLRINGDGRFETLLENGSDRVWLRSADKLGNVTNVEISEKNLRKPSELLAAKDAAVMADNGFSRISKSKIPTITFANCRDRETVFLKIVETEVRVSAENDIEELTISIQNENRPDVSVLDKLEDVTVSGPFVGFTLSLDLDSGENSVIARVREKGGRTVEKEIVFVRKTTGIRKPEHRYALKMFAPDREDAYKQSMPGNFLGGFLFEKHERSWDKKTSALFHCQLQKNFIEKQRFLLVGEEGLKNLIMAYHTETPVLRKTERGADAVMLGETFETAEGIEIVVRMVDIKSSVELESFDVFAENKDAESVAAIAGVLSEKIHGTFPMSDGVIRDVRLPDCIADFPNGKPMRGWPVLIYRFEHQHRKPSCVSRGGTDTRIIAEGKMSKEMIRILGEADSIRPGDRVITR